MIARWVTGLLFGAVALGAAWAGHYWWLIFLMALLWLASSEWRALGQLSDVLVDVPVVGAGLLFSFVGISGRIEFLAFLPLLLLFPAVSMLMRQEPERVKNMVWTGAGFVWLSLPAALLYMTREKYGFLLLVVLLAATIVQDTFALYSGMMLGGSSPFAPGISPNKTWAGFVGSITGALSVFLVVAYYLGWPLHFSVSLGLLLGAVGQIGDLSISALKRRVDLDDTGTFFPGHGGILDRVDGLILNVTVFYPYCVWLSDLM